MAADPVAAASAPRRPALGDEGGFGVLEMLIAITILTVGILALVTTFSASALSLHRSSERGTAVTIAESQMEVYRTVSFDRIRLASGSIPASGQYVTGHSQDSNIPPSSNQAVGGDANNDAACPDSDFPAACLPVQTLTGPDGGQQFTVDTYIDYANNDATLSLTSPASGLTLKRVTVVVRDPNTQAVLAEDTSAFQGP